jgi:glutamate/tyrosine decarboxylase-like PLP-dependent enzyme
MLPTSTDLLAHHIDLHLARLGDAPLRADVSPQEIRSRLSRYDFGEPHAVSDLFSDVTDMLWRWSEHAGNPAHLGLFRPAVDRTAVVAEALAALYDPNLATWGFSPAAAEIERHVLGVLGARIGFDVDEGAAHFTSGGQESNHTAVVAALTARYPDVGASGLRALAASPVVYVSQEGHHSLDKVAHATGLGRRALRAVPVDATLRMDTRALAEQIRADRARGEAPLAVVGTAGTTNAGAIDPLPELADICAHEGLWFHVDAAWGGSAAVSDRLRPFLAGIERADSVTWDAHKWLSVPVSAGMFFCRHRTPVERAFAVDAAYVPPQRDALATDSLSTSLQWSRRFMGLKVFMVLAEHGLGGVARRIERQAAMGEELRGLLRRRGWSVLNDTPLPVVCFTHQRLDHERDARRIVVDLARSGAGWISETRLRGTVPALRACITHFDTGPDHLQRLVDTLERALP